MQSNNELRFQAIKNGVIGARFSGISSIYPPKRAQKSFIFLVTLHKITINGSWHAWKWNHSNPFTLFLITHFADSDAHFGVKRFLSFSCQLSLWSALEFQWSYEHVEFHCVFIVSLRVSDGQHCDLKITNERDQIDFNGIKIRGSIVKIVNSVLMRSEYKKKHRRKDFYCQTYWSYLL